jgi:hypothetical protein
MNLDDELLQQHKDFLRLVHSSAGGGDHLYLGERLPSAIRRYWLFWLPLVAENDGKADLVPPVDVAWVWHLHRLAPLRYAAFCVQHYGKILDPKSAMFKVQSEQGAVECQPEVLLNLKTQLLWAQKFDEPFFQAPVGGGVAYGPRDPLSKQTTIAPAVKEACEKVREELGFDYDVETCSSRQRTFLWQVSRPAFENNPHLAIQRYAQFLQLMKVHGYDSHFFVPSYDIDFAWHTHMLTDTSRYLEESAELAGVVGGVDHDDSVNQRNEGSKLNLAWKDTKQMWATTFDTDDDGIETPGVTYRGEPPSWWFEQHGASIFRVQDSFLTEAETNSALHELQLETNVQGFARSGMDMVCKVEAATSQRIRAELKSVANDSAGSVASGSAGSGNNVEASQEPSKEPSTAAVSEAELPSSEPEEMPARVCPATKSVPLHKDKYYGRGPSVNTWIAVVYLTNNVGSSLVLVDDLTGEEHRIDIVAGRLCCWPNSRFSHKVDAAGAVAQETTTAMMTNAAACDQSKRSIDNSRCMLGPVALYATDSASAERSRDVLLYTEGGCRGGGCGGGGSSGVLYDDGKCAYGGYDSYGGGGGLKHVDQPGIPPIADSATIRILGVSSLTTMMNRTDLTTARHRAGALVKQTFSPRPYKTTVNAPFMNPGMVSEAMWAHLQVNIGQMEQQQLAPLAISATPPQGCDVCCNQPKVKAFAAIAARIKATRDSNIVGSVGPVWAAIVAQLALHGVVLAFGGINSAYYLTAAPGVIATQPMPIALASGVVATQPMPIALASIATVIGTGTVVDTAPGGSIYNPNRPPSRWLQGSIGV